MRTDTHTHLLTPTPAAVMLYHQTNYFLISACTSEVPAIKYAVSLKCKLTAAQMNGLRAGIR